LYGCEEDLSEEEEPSQESAWEVQLVGTKEQIQKALGYLVAREELMQESENVLSFKNLHLNKEDLSQLENHLVTEFLIGRGLDFSLKIN
jgi:hypothetical protein